MPKTNETEKWKDVKFDFDYVNDVRIQISNHGRLRSFHKFSNGNIINGSMIKGYRIIRFKFHAPRSAEKQRYFENKKKQIVQLTRRIARFKQEKNTKRLVKEATSQLTELKKKNSVEVKADLKLRTIHTHWIVHRLVATYFLKKPTKKQEVVAHLDFDKLNNKASNLKWMTREENLAHQRKSPHVINAKRNGKLNKLKEIDVARIKKLLKNGALVSRLAKRYKVSDTQILRIKRGENWAEVKPAK